MAENLCGLQAAESNRAVIRYIKEDPECWGLTPTTGITREMRTTEPSLTASKETTISAELRADRMISDVIETAASSGGDISVEFSAGSLDDFLEAFLMGAWSRPMTFDRFKGSNVTIQDNVGTTEIVVAGSDVTGYFVVGRRVKTEGFLDPVNNSYWEIASTSFAGGLTTIVTTGTTGVDEVSSSSTTVMDANDVVILKDTTIRAGTGTTNTFDSNGGNAFATAVIADEFVVGQKIYVEGLGYEEGTLTVGIQPADGEFITIKDGVRSVTFEFDNDSAWTRGNVGVTIGGTTTITADNLRDAIMGQYWANKVQVGATSAVNVVTVVNYELDQIANAADTSITDGTGGNVTVVDFAGATNTFGVYTLAAITDDVLTVVEPVDVNANGSAVSVTIKGSHLRNPGDLEDITAQSFSLETGYTDVEKYFLQDGMRVGSFTLSVATGEPVTGSVSFVGKETTVDDFTTLGTAPYTVLDSTTTSIFNATTNVGDVYKNGVKLASALQSLEITGEANLREQRAVGSRFAAGVGAGKFDLTGTINTYFETLEMYDHFLAHDTISVSFDFSDVDTNVYWFTIPAMIITSDPITPGGIDQDVIEPMEWVAKRDGNLRTQFMIDRFSSTTPVTG